MATATLESPEGEGRDCDHWEREEQYCGDPSCSGRYVVCVKCETILEITTLGSCLPCRNEAAVMDMEE